MRAMLALLHKTPDQALLYLRTLGVTPPIMVSEITRIFAVKSLSASGTVRLDRVYQCGLQLLFTSASQNAWSL